MRYKTKTFQLIENYLKTCCDKCFRAHDVYDYIVANEMKVNISTVYRNLEQFVEAGQLIKSNRSGSNFWSRCGFPIICSIHWERDGLFLLQTAVADELCRFVRRDHAVVFGVGAVHGEEIHRAAAVGAELPEDDPSVRFKKPDVAVVKLGAPPEIRRAALFDPRRERIVRDRNGKIGVRALRHGDGVPEHALTALRLFLLSAYRFRTERSRRQKKEKAKVALSVADGGIVW